MTEQVRVRFAPSPTGPLHIGGVRTALYNYLFARHNGGKMILRIEDTDRNRFVPGAEEYIIESLKWCGIETDEGPEQGGPYAPYRQSERKDLYRQYAVQLVQEGKAYYAFDTPEELENLRKVLDEENAPNKSYCAATRNRMRNSLTLPADEVNRLLDEGVPCVIRFKMPEQTTVHITDMIRGNIEVSTDTLDDKVLFKQDGMPTYHLANIVDDHLMEISHVIRGEEWLPSLPLHILLYEAFGWQKPQFAHLPLILKPSGKGKLSKRDGDKEGFPVFPIDWKNQATGEAANGFREAGYLPEAFVNILALLGWNPGENADELMDMQTMTTHFSIEKVSRSGARFDPAKARWVNHQYLQKMSDEELSGVFSVFLLKKGIRPEKEKLVRIVTLVKERVHLIPELWDQADFFFEAPEHYDEKLVRKRWNNTMAETIKSLIPILEKINPFTASDIETAVKEELNSREISPGPVMQTLRLMMVGSGRGPGLFDIFEVLGREEVVRRINQAINKLPKK